MNIFRIWKKGIKAEKGDILLRLISNVGHVILVVVDQNGERLDTGTLMRFANRGVTLEGDVGEKIGLPLDNDGNILFNVPLKDSEDEDEDEDEGDDEDEKRRDDDFQTSFIKFLQALKNK